MTLDIIFLNEDEIMNKIHLQKELKKIKTNALKVIQAHHMTKPLNV